MSGYASVRALDQKYAWLLLLSCTLAVHYRLNPTFDVFQEIPGASSPRVFVLRDKDTVAALAEKLADSRKILVVGNGGIALQLVSSLQNIEVRSFAVPCLPIFQ